ncbi:saccharopine dehydrogenase family protein [Thermomonospora umbrina]|nr:saccharopine dehydrogenase NADP-binding domain-containing protein [Thermomonospora umbrina]
MTPSAVLVVGGYGAVGSAVTVALAAGRSRPVLPAGRDLARARLMAAEAGGGPGVRVDITDPAAFEKVLDEHRVGAVVLCVEPPDTEIARVCLSRGVHLVDVGASDRLLAPVEALTALAVARGATAVLSVGVAPGLTNLLARRAHDDLGGADRLDLTVMLGAGERHGADAVRWTLTQLLARTPSTAAGSREVGLPGYGRRRAHPFPFSDQHTLRRTLGVPEATTRLCLDSRPLTAALFALRRTGVLGVARHPRVLRALTDAVTRVHVGGDGFALRADARLGERSAAYALIGREQGRITGVVAAHVTRRLLDGGLPHGVHHIDELPALAHLAGEIPGTTLLRLRGTRVVG